MKFTTATVAAFAGLAAAAKDTTNWGVLRFNGKEIIKGRIDPIVAPGKVAEHVHAVMGGSAFTKDSTGESQAQSKCTNARVLEDRSAYWFPALYFQDPATKAFEPVDIHYVNVYYFFDATNDEMKAFPKGLQLVAGDATKRTAPSSGGRLITTSNSDFGEPQPVQWTCPRDGNNFDNPPSWPTDSDGSTSGIRDPNNKGTGAGFPDVTCDGFASPLRADVHMPSCYNPEAGLTNYKSNSAYPKAVSGGKFDCPEGWIHVPHMFYEVYWDTPKFKGRWTENQGTQPFVLSNGDVTGFASHADFLAAWDEDALQNLIDNCDARHSGLHTCAGVTDNNQNDCKAENQNQVDEIISGVLSKLPGDRPLEGWTYGVNTKPTTDVEEEVKPEPEVKPTTSSAQYQAPVQTTPAESTTAQPTPTPAEVVVEQVEAQEEHDDVYDTPAPAPTPTPASPPAGKPPGNPRVKTVWETVTVTATETADYGYATPDVKAVRRHVHNHVRHRRSHF
ncbi:WSC domain-containing protein [Plectosphaerella cucumerina]|uniref:WSC domain-containing protein n=1 Tax=Plectosphaerella cucumerina TaxID=40658 RepID=A0A8K0TEU7_9PEZI|nr:WSC domain-containing protein [Plectosphaerella cucumerina]